MTMTTTSIFLLASVLSMPPKKAPTVAPDAPRLVVMTYNVNFGLAGDATTLAAIRDADVVFLQETNDAWERAIREALADEYPYMEFIASNGSRIAGGQAVLSKHPLERIQTMQEDWFPAGAFVIDTPLGKIQALNVHLRPGFSEKGSVVSGYFTTPKIRKREISEFWSELDPELPTLVAGDFNENDGKALAFLKKQGLRSATPKRAKTWRWDTRFVTLKGRLDHIVHDARLTPVESKVLDEGRSDHLPVVVTFVASP